MSRHDAVLAVVCLVLTTFFLGAPHAAQGEVQSTEALWVADKDQIHKFSPAGSPVLSVTTPSKPITLATDPSTGAVWVGHENALSKYAFDGTLLFHIPLAGEAPQGEDDDDDGDDDDGDSDDDDDEDADVVLLTVDPTQGRPWVAWGHLLLALEADGTERFRVRVAEESMRSRTMHRTGKPGSQAKTAFPFTPTRVPSSTY